MGPMSVPKETEKGKELLMIFARNPEKGKVKKRLARTVGEENALRIYQELLAHTARVITPLDLDKQVLYSEHLPEKDPFGLSVHRRGLQKGEELGERMATAFRDAFSEGYERVVIIGSDCYELSSEVIQKAFQALRHDQKAVLGPAEDGGYYLLGTTSYIDPLFRNKSWGGNNVLLDTLVDLRSEKLQYHLLPTLNDVDEEADLGPLRKLLQEERS